MVKATRNRPGSVVTSCKYIPVGFGATNGLPISGPRVASRNAALSRTLTVSAWRVANPCQGSVSCGPSGVRPRVGFMPKTPLQLAGIRSEPPPSPPVAMGTILIATAIPDPPLEPPAVRSGAHGFRAVPYATGSVTPVRPNSGQFVFPQITAPDARQRRAISLSSRDTFPSNDALPAWYGVPATSPSRSFTRRGTPWNAPSPRPLAIMPRPKSSSRWTTALTRGFNRSIRSRALFRTSVAVTSPFRIRPASPSPSRCEYSRNVAIAVPDHQGPSRPATDRHFPLRQDRLMTSNQSSRASPSGGVISSEISNGSLTDPSRGFRHSPTRAPVWVPRMPSRSRVVPSELPK